MTEPRGRPVLAWLYRIAANLVRDHYTSARVRREATVAVLAEPIDPAPGPEAHALAGETVGRVRAALTQLTPDQQRCLRLRFFAGLSVAETATAMHRSGEAVKVLQHRAVRHLARLLDVTA